MNAFLTFHIRQFLRKNDIQSEMMLKNKNKNQHGTCISLTRTVSMWKIRIFTCHQSRSRGNNTLKCICENKCPPSCRVRTIQACELTMPRTALERVALVSCSPFVNSVHSRFVLYFVSRYQLELPFHGPDVSRNIKSS